MIQELSTSNMTHMKIHSVEDRVGHRPSVEDAKCRSSSSESDSSFQSVQSNSNSSTCQSNTCRHQMTHLHNNYNNNSKNNNKSKKTNKISQKKHNTIDSDFVINFICRRP
ncbi:putative uncharacterized protein DDB_G0284715 [Palaemon carinicauda]|uniref:putative uncharacterized protein DDB_G0284715 n=1 Tax=Palaemon carinicauda TaxID=392227 RepID=UPI0035B65A9A